MIRKTLSTLLPILCLALQLQAKTEQANPTAFAALLEDKAAVLVDVRTPAEIEQGKIPGALEIDFRSETFAEDIAKLPRDKTILLYCRSGNRSGQTAAYLESLGYKRLVNLEGGILAWTEENRPLNTSQNKTDGSPPSQPLPTRPSP